MSTRLSDLPYSQVNELDKEFHRRLTADDGRKLLRHPKILDAMLATMRQHEDFRLIHGRFHPLEDKLEMVRGWPGVTGAMIDAAIDEAWGRIKRFREESPKHPFLNIVVSRYLGSAHETLVYARDRMRETFGNAFWQWDAYANGVDENRVRYLQATAGQPIVPIYPNCVRVEVVDLAANWDRKNAMPPRDVRGAKSAHAAVFFAAAEDPEWVRQMDGEKVPYALAGGFELNDPAGSNDDLWVSVPSVCSEGDGACLYAYWYAGSYHQVALPSLWE